LPFDSRNYTDRLQQPLPLPLATKDEIHTHISRQSTPDSELRHLATSDIDPAHLPCSPHLTLTLVTQWNR